MYSGRGPGSPPLVWPASVPTPQNSSTSSREPARNATCSRLVTGSSGVASRSEKSPHSHRRPLGEQHAPPPTAARPTRREPNHGNQGAVNLLGGVAARGADRQVIEHVSCGANREAGLRKGGRPPRRA